jgi:hypothetical protein
MEHVTKPFVSVCALQLFVSDPVDHAAQVLYLYV